MSTDELLIPQPERQPGMKSGTWLRPVASMCQFPISALVNALDEVAKFAERQAVLIRTTDSGSLVLMSVTDYSKIVDRVAPNSSSASEFSQQNANTPSSSYVLPQFQDNNEYWAALEQMARLDRQAQEWERTNGSDPRTLDVFTKACQVFEHVVPAIDWLSRPNALLAGMKPSRLMATDAGAQRVLNALGKIEHGIPV